MSVRNTVKSIQDIMRQDSGVDGDAQRISQLCWMFFLKIIDDQDRQFELMQDGYKSPIPKKLQWRSWAADPEGITGDELLTFVNTQLFSQLKELTTTGNQGERRRVVRDVFEDAYNYMKSGQLMRQVINKINEVDFNNLAERQHFGDIYEQILNDLQSAGNAGEYYTPRAVTAFMVDRIDPRPGELLLDPACGTGGFLTCALRHMREHYVKRVEDEQTMQQALRAVEKKQLPHMLCVTNMLLHGIENPSFVRHDNTLARPYISYTTSDRVDIVLTNPPFGGREEDGIESNFPKHFQTRETADLFLALIIRILKPGGRAAVVLPDGSLFGEGVKTRLKEALLEECNLHTIVRLPNSVFKPYTGIGTNLLFFEKGRRTKEIWFYEHRVPDGLKAYSMTRPIRVEHLKPCVDWWGGAKRKGRVVNEVAWKVTVDEVKTRNYNLDFKNPHTIADDHGDPAELLAKLDESEHRAANLHDQLKAVLAEAHFHTELLPRLTTSPAHIQQLRQTVLNLAMRGRLIPQDPTDEPASELLAKIRAEKHRIVNEKRTTASERFPTITSNEIPYQLPLGWEWARLGHLGDTNIGLTYSPQDVSDHGVPVLRSNNIRNGKLVLSELVRVDINVKESALAREGDLLICARNGSRALVGKTAIIPQLQEITAFGAFMAIFRSSLNKYIYHFICSPLFRLMIAEVNTTTINQITQSNLRSTLAPIPPLAEQHRIVAKVEELMTLCDGLESELTTKQTETQRLLEAVLHNALL